MSRRNLLCRIKGLTLLGPLFKARCPVSRRQLPPTRSSSCRQGRATAAREAIAMDEAIRRFLQYLSAERNASPLTLKSYREDLEVLRTYLAQSYGQNLPAPGDLTTLDLRGYSAYLHNAGYAKSTIARRLASLRSFFRFGNREGWCEENPAKPLRNPRRSRKLPHFLSSEELAMLLEAPPANEPMGLRDRSILEV